MKYIVYLLFIFFSSCQNVKIKSKQDIDFKLNYTVMNSISKQCELIDSSIHLFRTTLCRLDNKVVAHIAPIFDSSRLSECGYPIIFFESQNRLILVYSGFEELYIHNISYQKIIRQKFDSVCSLYQISKINFTYDKGPFFFELQNDSLFKIRNNKEFIISFFGIEVDDSKILPIEIK